MNYRAKYKRGEAVWDWMTQKKGYFVGSEGDADILFFGDPKAPGAEEAFQKMCEDFDRGDTVFLAQNMSYEVLCAIKQNQRRYIDWLTCCDDEE